MRGRGKNIVKREIRVYSGSFRGEGNATQDYSREGKPTLKITD